MQTQPTTMPPACRPVWCAELYRDPHGNWFAAVTAEQTTFTATFSTPREALEEAWRVTAPE